MSKQKKYGNAAKNTPAGTESVRISQRFGRITSTLMTIYVLFYLCVFPLATHDKYFDILKFRFQLYWIPTLIYGVLFLVLGVLYLLTDKKDNSGVLTTKLKENLKWSVLKTKLTKTDICFIALIFIMTLSVLFADYQYEAFWGNLGRWNGLLLWLMFFIAYGLVTRFYHFRKWHLYAYLIAACLPEIWGITDFFLLDLLHFHSNTEPQYIYTFVSSVGNINTYTNMVALHLGASVAMFVLSKNRIEALVSWAALLVASFAIVMGMSDNGLLAVATIFAILPFASWTSLQNICYYFAALSTFATSSAITACLTIKQSTMAECGESILIMVGKTKVFLALVILLWIFTVAVCYRFHTKKNEQETQGVRCVKMLWTMFIAIGIASSLIILVDANMGKHREIWKSYQNILVFNDAWGTGRGIIWRFALEFFTEKSSILDKLIGNGPDTFYIITMDYFKKAMKAAGNITYDSVHNEYLECLVTIGIMGTIAYLGTLLTSLQQMFKKPQNHYAVACGIAVLAYAVQAVVNIAVPITMPILMMLLYMGISIAKESEEDRTEMEKRKGEL